MLIRMASSWAYSQASHVVTANLQRSVCQCSVSMCFKTNIFCVYGIAECMYLRPAHHDSTQLC